MAAVVTESCNDPSIQAYRGGCRCPGCRSINAERSREWRRQQSGPTLRVIADTPHHHLTISEAFDCTFTLEEWKRNNGSTG